MPKLIEVKVRPVGNSLGIIIPKEIAEKENLRVGEKIFITMLKKKTIKIEEVIASIKEAAPFEREHKDRF